MYNLTLENLKKVINKIFEGFPEDIVTDTYAIINGKNPKEGDIVVYTSRKGYDEFVKEVLTGLKNEKQ